MESLSPQVVSTAKLPILNPNEFDLWKMRIEQYFLMTDYSLWEVILNGDSLAPTRVIDGSSSESLDQIQDRLQKLISQLEILRVSLSQEDINLNTNEPVSAAASVSVVSAKISISPLLNVDSLSNIDADDLEEMDLKWQMAILTVECYNCHRKGHFVRECRSPKYSKRNAMTEVFKQMRNLPTMLSWHSHLHVLLLTMRDNALVVLRQNIEKAEQERDNLKIKLEKLQTSSKNISELLASQTNDKTGLGYNSQVFTRAMFDCDDYLSSGSDESLLPSPIYDRYQSGNGYHAVPPPYTGTFMPPKPDLVFNNAPNDVETHSAFIVKLSPTKPDQDLPFVKHVETSIPIATSKRAIPKPIINGKCRNRKACFVCKSLDHLIKECDYHEKEMAQPTARNHAKRGTHTPVTMAVPKTSVTRPRQAKVVVTKPNSPPKRNINRSLSPKASTFPPKVTAVKAPMINVAHGNPQHALKDKGVIDSGCSRHMTGNMSYLSDFEELNGGYVAFGGKDCAQITKISQKPDNINTRSEVSNKSQINKQFSQNNHTLKLKISKIQYPEVHPSSQEKSEEVSQAKEDLINSIQTFLEEFHCIPLEEKPQILLEAWFKFFAIKHDQPKNSNELFQKLLEDLKKLAEYKESLENASNEIATSSSNQEKEDPPQDFDIRKLIREECCVEVSEEQKQKMEDTIPELVKICLQKELYCIHDNVEDLIESALNSKLLSINSQRFDKKEQEVKNIVEQPADVTFHIFRSFSTSFNSQLIFNLIRVCFKSLSLG
nr:zinc finger, CCHC-type [Tanacetum cinerariifolium]